MSFNNIQWTANQNIRGRGSRGNGRNWRGGSAESREFRTHRGTYRNRSRTHHFSQTYPTNRYQQEPPWINSREHFTLNRQQLLPTPQLFKPPDRPSSPPLPGTEKYMQRDISEKSAVLKRVLELDDASSSISGSSEIDCFNVNFTNDAVRRTPYDDPFLQNSVSSYDVDTVNNKPNNKSNQSVSPPGRNKRQAQRSVQQKLLNVKDIHNRIINYISNLSYDKKKSLINQQGLSSYDFALQEVSKQIRLNLSRALRDVCNNKFTKGAESSEVINSIIPDFDIKIEELPRELVEQLSVTLNEDFEENIQTTSVDPEVLFQQAADMLNIPMGVDQDNEILDTLNTASGSRNVAQNQLDTPMNHLDLEFKETAVTFPPMYRSNISTEWQQAFSNLSASTSIDFAIPPLISNNPSSTDIGYPQPSSKSLQFRDHYRNNNTEETYNPFDNSSQTVSAPSGSMMEKNAHNYFPTQSNEKPPQSVSSPLNSYTQGFNQHCNVNSLAQGSIVPFSINNIPKDVEEADLWTLPSNISSSFINPDNNVLTEFTEPYDCPTSTDINLRLPHANKSDKDSISSKEPSNVTMDPFSTEVKKKSTKVKIILNKQPVEMETTRNIYESNLIKKHSVEDEMNLFNASNCAITQGKMQTAVDTEENATNLRPVKLSHIDDNNVSLSKLKVNSAKVDMLVYTDTTNVKNETNTNRLNNITKELKICTDKIESARERSISDRSRSVSCELDWADRNKTKYSVYNEKYDSYEMRRDGTKQKNSSKYRKDDRFPDERKHKYYNERFIHERESHYSEEEEDWQKNRYLLDKSSHNHRRKYSDYRSEYAHSQDYIYDMDADNRSHNERHRVKSKKSHKRKSDKHKSSRHSSTSSKILLHEETSPKLKQHKRSLKERIQILCDIKTTSKQSESDSELNDHLKIQSKSVSPEQSRCPSVDSVKKICTSSPESPVNLNSVDDAEQPITQPLIPFNNFSNLNEQSQKEELEPTTSEIAPVEPSHEDASEVPSVAFTLTSEDPESKCDSLEILNENADSQSEITHPMQRLWRSPGEKKFMTEQVENDNSAVDIEKPYEVDHIEESVATSMLVDDSIICPSLDECQNSNHELEISTENKDIENHNKLDENKCNIEEKNVEEKLVETSEAPSVLSLENLKPSLVENPIVLVPILTDSASNSTHKQSRSRSKEKSKRHRSKSKVRSKPKDSTEGLLTPDKGIKIKISVPSGLKLTSKNTSSKESKAPEKTDKDLPIEKVHNNETSKHKRSKTKHSGTSGYKNDRNKSVPTPVNVPASVVSKTNCSTQTFVIKNKSIHMQTDNKLTKSSLVQTNDVFLINIPVDIEKSILSSDKSSRRMLKSVQQKKIVQHMFDIDKEIEKLTKLRQALYNQLQASSDSEEEKRTANNSLSVINGKRHIASREKPNKQKKVAKTLKNVKRSSRLSVSKSKFEGADASVREHSVGTEEIGQDFSNGGNRISKNIEEDEAPKGKTSRRQSTKTKCGKTETFLDCDPLQVKAEKSTKESSLQKSSGVNHRNTPPKQEIIRPCVPVAGTSFSDNKRSATSKNNDTSLLLGFESKVTQKLEPTVEMYKFSIKDNNVSRTESHKNSSNDTTKHNSAPKQKKRKRKELHSDIDTETPSDDCVDRENRRKRKKLNSNYKSKKRRSTSSENNTDTIVLNKGKLVYEHPVLLDSVVNIARYSLEQLEDMRKNICQKNNKDVNNPSVEMNVKEEENLPCSEDPENNLEENKISLEENKIALEENKIALEENKIALEENKIVLEEPQLLNDNLLNEPTVIEENTTETPTESQIEQTSSVIVKDEMQIQEQPDPDVINLENIEENITEYENNKQLSDDLSTVELSTSINCDDVFFNCEDLEILDEDEGYQMDFKGFPGAILVIKVIAATALAASDKGKIFCFNMHDGTLINTFDVSNLAITSMYIAKQNDVNIIHAGSLDSTLILINFDTKEIVKRIQIEEPVQCMEYSWDYIFIGSDRGSLLRFNTITEQVDTLANISDFNVLVIKATQEGPRKVLVIATRNAPVSIRDASSGLLLRSMETPFSPTVYTLLFDKNLVYCGTSQHDILVYTFEDGQLIFKHEATKSKGVVCMQIIGNLLFAGCYNGNIYVYNTKTNVYLGTMNGPGGLMLCMEIVNNKIIVGTKLNHFRAWRIPQKYLDQM